MEIRIQRRAEIALRSLQRSEQKQIIKALNKISSVTSKDLFQIPNFHKLRGELRQNLYVYRGSENLRLVLSVRDNVCTVEDIVAHDKLDRLLHSLEQ